MGFVYERLVTTKRHGVLGAAILGRSGLGECHQRLRSTKLGKQTCHLARLEAYSTASRRSRRLAVENHRSELRDLMLENGAVGAEVRKTIGDVATAFVVAGVATGVVVLQAAGHGAGNMD